MRPLQCSFQVVFCKGQPTTDDQDHVQLPLFFGDVEETLVPFQGNPHCVKDGTLGNALSVIVRMELFQSRFVILHDITCDSVAEAIKGRRHITVLASALQQAFCVALCVLFGVVCHKHQVEMEMASQKKVYRQ